MTSVIILFMFNSTRKKIATHKWTIDENSPKMLALNIDEVAKLCDYCADQIDSYYGILRAESQKRRYFNSSLSLSPSNRRW